MIPRRLSPPFASGLEQGISSLCSCHTKNTRCVHEYFVSPPIRWDSPLGHFSVMLCCGTTGMWSGVSDISEPLASLLGVEWPVTVQWLAM